MSITVHVDGREMSWNEVCEYAAEIGDRTLLKLAHRHGGKLTLTVTEYSLMYGQETGNYECYTYIQEEIEKETMKCETLAEDFSNMMVL